MWQGQNRVSKNCRTIANYFIYVQPETQMRKRAKKPNN